MSAPATSAACARRRVWDSRGRPTVEAEVTLPGGAVGRAIAPAGASTGSGEALDLRDGGARFGGLDVSRRVGHVNGEIARALRRRSTPRPGGAGPAPDRARRHAAQVAARRQRDAGRVDGRGPCRGSGARRAAVRYLGGAEATLLPLPQIQIFGGGAHAGRRVDVQDFLVICPGARELRAGAGLDRRGLPRAGALMEERGTLQGVADEGGWWPDFADQRAGAGHAGAGDRARRLRAGRAGGDRARHRGVRVRPRRPLQAGPGGARARHATA